MSDPQQFGAQALEGMSPEGIVAALEAGHLRDYLSGEEPAGAPPEVEQYGSAWTAGKSPEEVDAAMRAGHLRAYLAGELP